MVGCGVELMAWAQLQFLGPDSDWYDAWAEQLCLGVLSGATTFVERRTGGSGESRRRVACRASTCLAIPTCSSRSLRLFPLTPLRLLCANSTVWRSFAPGCCYDGEVDVGSRIIPRRGAEFRALAACSSSGPLLYSLLFYPDRRVTSF